MSHHSTSARSRALPESSSPLAAPAEPDATPHAVEARIASPALRARGRRRRAAVPAAVTTLLVSTTMAVAPSAVASVGATLGASDSTWVSNGSAFIAAAGSSSGDASSDSRDAASATPVAYTLLPGEHLRAKPTPWVLPVSGYTLTAGFGQVSGLWAHTHTGQDFAAPEGTPIHAVAPGTVVSVGYDGAFGNKTVIRLDNGTELWFCHQSRTLVSPGQRVGIGQLIGLVGATGNVTGPHLHLEVHPGGGPAIDPLPWLRAHGMHP